MRLLTFTIVYFFSQLFISIGAVVNGDDSTSNTFPVNLDWRTRGVITPIYSQGQSPYVAAITMVETIESLYAIETGNLTRGSVARVIDCCPKFIVDFECIVRLGGICRDSDYPTARGTCEPNACVPFATFEKLIVFRGLDDEQLVPLIQNATLLVSVDAASIRFMEYQNGTYRG
ncbi:unnamed protein product [Rotaria sordida]|uniref:Peptidase C1A papain C-terminal domain-containing protein n=1 Tax=Rotaria sordida TaxID=392033 RepID=A0A814DAQ5_9BILA|nr:unnamed protein product [Rotaria sordida]CAF0951712.1 unnamed protein product [Rotaria sordida]